GDAHDGATAGGEVLLEAVQVDHGLALTADDGQHYDASADQVAVVVGIEPVERGARAARAVDGRGADQDDLVGQLEDARHGGVQQSGAAVGDTDRVVVLKDADHRTVVIGAERHGDAWVAVRREDLQPA